MDGVFVDVREAKSLKERVVGLIGKPEAHGILLRTRFGIHTFGLRYPIDVVVLNHKNEIVKVKNSLKPHKFFFWSPEYTKVLELPAGSIEKNGLKLGTVVKIDRSD